MLIGHKNQTRSFNQTNRPIYYLEDVSIDFGNITALNSVHLEIFSGEVFFITGPSGAGKTTLLKILANELSPRGGRAVIPNSSEKFIAQVFQEQRLLENLSCEDNLWVSFDKKVHKNKNNFYQEMERLASVLGIHDRLNIKVKNANGGLLQKISILRAVLSRPEILLLDEPTSSMEKASAMKVFELLSYFNSKQNMTIVWATHNRELVKQFTGKIAHLDKGKLIYTGRACFI